MINRRAVTVLFLFCVVLSAAIASGQQTVKVGGVKVSFPKTVTGSDSILVVETNKVTKSADTGVLVQVAMKISGGKIETKPVDSGNRGLTATTEALPRIEVPFDDFKLLGPQWSESPIAIGFRDTRGECAGYRFVGGSKAERRGFSKLTVVEGKTSTVRINTQDLMTIEGVAVPLCIVFRAPETARKDKLRLQIGTEVPIK